MGIMSQNLADVTFTFSYLADTFIRSDLQMRTIEAIKTNKRATTCKCYDSVVASFFFFFFLNTDA